MRTDFFRGLIRAFVPLLLLSVPLAQARGADTLLVLGDSISAAYGLDESQGWVQLLRDRLRDGDNPVEVVNASISGETSSGGLARLPRLLQEHEPRWLIVELGGNDGLRGYSPRALQQNLQRMVRLAREADAEVLILGMRMPPNYGRAYTEAFAAVYPQVAEAESVPLIPFFLEPVALQEGAMQADGIHPTAMAQAALLDHVWPCVQALLGESPVDACSP
ncbi:arylesterase [Microbulbifer rhizosphaerae]|uniref:Acyl-CoA thioesterase-1 n=1 Tax=Microbulbifer rhizosphaerae TaxID=1562603 RepID=A0A7W4WCQ7_9GAMM|nr:arylesterase [Microbulbifer rhizosphaerae]MBB3061845.1 acyl-CoA thioesterase-1 [Microbulbifer rhizosphaerae]